MFYFHIRDFYFLLLSYLLSVASIIDSVIHMHKIGCLLFLKWHVTVQ